MAKSIRTIKADLCDDETLGALPITVRYLFVGLVTRADDHGRFRANPALVRSRVFPYDGLDCDTVAGWLKELEASGRIVTYTVDGQAYGVLVNWGKHQRLDNAAKSEIPPPPELSCGELEPEPELPAEVRADSPQVAAECGESPLEWSGEEGSGGDGADAATAANGRKPPKGRATRVPIPFVLTDDMFAWLSENLPDVDYVLETEKFVDHFRSKAGKDATHLDWPATWRNWMRNSVNFGAKR